MGELKQRGRIWWIRYYRNGQRHEESAHSTKKQAAIDLLRVREGDIAKGAPVSARAMRLRWEDAAADVVTDYKVNGKRSVAHVERRITLHLTPFFGGRRMSAITTSTIRTFIAHRQAPVTHDDGSETPGASNAEINRELAIVKRAFRLATQAGKLLYVPHIPMLRESNVRQGFFEREQFEAVRDHLPKPWQPVVAFAHLTGWRIRSEVLGLTWSNVDTDAKVVRLEAGTTKNDEGRVFPYGDLPDLKAVITGQEAVRDELRAQGIITPWLFPDAAGNRLPAFYAEIWRRACDAAGCPGRIPHDFRRTAVRNLVRAGVSEKTAMMLTGHKTRSVFDRYDIVNEGDLRDAVARLADATGTKKGQSRDRGQVVRMRRSL